MSLATCPPGELPTDPAGPTELLQNKWLMLPRVPWDHPCSAGLAPGSPGISDGDRELVVELEPEIWPCLLAAAVVPLTF